MKPSLPIHQSSGLNDAFLGMPAESFADYIERCRQMIAAARVDLSSDTREKIIDANAPCEWSSASPARQGLLLVHGLYDSPFTLKALGDHFSTQGLLVRSILLPGHGTVPGDLLNVSYVEWLKAVDYGVESLAKEVDQIFVMGFSLGGVLTLHKALTDSRIKGILLISPALALQSQWLVGQLVRWRKWVTWALPHQAWYKKRDVQQDYCKYESFACNAGVQIYRLILETQTLLQQNALSIPLFLTISADDEVVCPTACWEFFTDYTLPGSQLLWYTNTPQTVADSRIITRSSAFPAEKIIDFSHICLPIQPENSHYGVQGDYQDFLAYPNNEAPLYREIFKGAVSRKNLKKYAMQRLSYNPDFNGMVQAMSEWFDFFTRNTL